MHSELKSVAVVAGPLGLQSEGALLRKESSTGGWRKRRKGWGEGGGRFEKKYMAQLPVITRLHE